MAAITQTNAPYRHVIGNMVLRIYLLSGNNGDTFTLPTGTIKTAFITPTTAIAVGATFTSSTITFVTAGAWAARVTVLTAVG